MYTNVNLMLLHLLRLIDPGIFEIETDLETRLKNLIISHPHKRFGWLVGTYLCPDYNEGNHDHTTDHILDVWFYNSDPLYEDPYESILRLLEQHRPIKID